MVKERRGRLEVRWRGWILCGLERDYMMLSSMQFIL